MIPSCEEQLELWVNGKSVHNKDRNECCPDFSCCSKGVDTPLEARLAFQRADQETRESMLGMFLGGMIAKEVPGAKIHVAGDPTNYKKTS